MKSGMIAAFIGVIGAITFTAQADSTSTYFVIEGLEAGALQEDGFGVDPLNYNVPNPKNCPSTGLALANPARSSAEKEAMNKLLLSAFLAGKKVTLFISDTTCSSGATTGFPVYNNVRVNYNQ